MILKAIGFDDSPHERKRAEKGCATFAIQEDEPDKYDLWFPLQDWHWTRDDCVAAIQRHGLPVPPKSSCFFCPAMKPAEVDTLEGDELRIIVVIEARIRRIVAYLSERMLELDLTPDRTPAQDHRLEVARFWYCAVLIGRYAGLRLGDICCLERASLARPGKLIVWTDKRDARVELDVDANLAKGIAAIPPSSKRFCFPEQDAIMRGPQRAKLSVQFSRILEACKIAGHSFHDLRHTFCSDCQRRGIPTPHIAKMVGHSDQETTKLYLH